MIPRLLLPESLYDNAFIAGSYAACPALAKDMDIWVKSEFLDIARECILRHLTGSAFDKTFGSARVRFETTPEDSTQMLRDEYGGISALCTTRKVAQVRDRTTGQLYHIRVTNGSVDQVLDSFDISTCMVALTQQGVVTGKYWTPITVTPIVIHDMPSTPARLKKLRERYEYGREYEAIQSVQASE